MSILKINLKDIVDGTSTNVEGCKLLIALDVNFKEGKKVELSLKNTTPMSSSFLNSSIGELVDKYGFKLITELLSFSNVSAFNAKNLKKYFQALKDYA